MDISSYIVIIFCLPIIALNTYQIIQICRQTKKIKKALEEHAFTPEFPNTKKVVPTKEELEDQERFFLASSIEKIAVYGQSKSRLGKTPFKLSL